MSDACSIAARTPPVNLDDPAYFDGLRARKLLTMQSGIGLPQDDVTLLARISIEASFRIDAAKRRWLSAADECAGSTKERR